ncbi:putative exported protein [Granulibacter bethesdensis]|nr:putative exported protein [Granulibacter bethesdensis]
MACHHHGALIMAGLAAFVAETANNPGTNQAVNLLGALSGYATFAARFSNGSTPFYFMRDATQWECGVGTLSTSPTAVLSRTTVLGNSQGNTQRLNFSGVLTIYNYLPPMRAVYIDDDQYVRIPALSASGVISCGGDLATAGNLGAKTGYFSAGTTFVGNATFKAYVITDHIGNNGSGKVAVSGDIEATGNGKFNSLNVTNWISATGIALSSNVNVGDSITFGNGYFRLYKTSNSTPVLWLEGTQKAIPWSDNVTAFKMVWPSSGSPYLEISSGGTYGVTVFTSDRALKTEFGPPDVSDMIGVIKTIPVVSYRWKENGASVPVGLVADDVAQAAPDAVFEVGESKTKTINPLTLITYLIGAMQQMAARLDALEQAGQSQ